MGDATDTFGAVFKNGSAVLMARIVDATGQRITKSVIDSIEYSVFELDPCRPDNLQVVAGHDGNALATADVLFDTLQVNPLWSVDEYGYNFRHEIDVSENPAFPSAGTSYQVRYEFTPSTGQIVLLRFQLRAI